MSDSTTREEGHESRRPSPPESPEKPSHQPFGQIPQAEAASPASGPLRGPARRAARRFRGWRAWLLRLAICVLSPALCFGLLEAGLRLGGYGYPTGFFLGPDANGVYTTNYRFGWRFFPRSLAQDPHPCTLSAKPAGSIRIFVLGESAAMGTPDPAFSFGRILAVMCREQYPGVQFEVVNGAMTAINSHAILEIARDCAARQPDLFVVYSGNNEVIGPFGPETVFQHWRMVRASLWVKSTRVGQLLGNTIARFRSDDSTPRHWRGMETFLDRPVAADDPRLNAVYNNFRRNLTDICGIAHRAGAGVVLSTVAVNLRDSPPLASRHRSGLTPEDLEKWESICKAGAALEASNRSPEALGQYEAAAKIDDRFAELQFRIARCLMKAGRSAEALARFELACDLDVFRYRADSRINAVIRAVAGEQQAAGVRLVDAAQKLAQSDADSQGIPGGDLFYEHVHLTFDGNYWLARAVLDQVRESLPQLAALKEQGVVPSRQRCAELLALTPWDEYQMTAAIVKMTSKRPFTNQLDHDLRQTEARRRRDDLRKRASTPQARQAAWRTYEAAIAKAPDDWNLHYHFGLLAMQFGRSDVAVEHLQVALQSLPWDAYTHDNLGNALAGCGQLEEAVAHYQKALEIKPEFAGAHFNLALALADRGQVEQAIAHYQKALEIAPDFAEAYFNLGNALKGRGQVEEAIAHYQKALEITPEFAEAHFNLALTLAERGQVEEAITHYQEALEIKPDFAEAHYDLANALTGRGQVEEAIVHYQKALEIRPDSAEAHHNLGVTLADRRQVEEAIAHYQKALKIRPDFAEAHYNLGNALADRRQVEEAIAHYQKALEIRPDFTEAHNALAIALAGRKRVDEAIAHDQKVLEIKPDSAEARYDLANALIGRGQVEEAIVHYQKALEIKRGFVEAHHNLGVALAGRGRVDEAIAHYQKALKIKPDFAEAHFNLGNALKGSGQVDEAIAHYQKALEIKPDFAEAHSNLGVALARCGRVDEAIAHFQKALKIKPDYVDARRNLEILQSKR